MLTKINNKKELFCINIQERLDTLLRSPYIHKDLSPQTFVSKLFNPPALSCQSSAGQPLLTLNASI